MSWIEPVKINAGGGENVTAGHDKRHMETLEISGHDIR